MDFVVMVLMNIFYKSREDAVSIMLQVHNSGKGVAGVYSFDIAVTKAGKATESARNAGHPLVFTVEPEN